MDKDQKNVNEFMTNAGQDVHTKLRIPTEQDINLSAKLILEEALETIHAMGARVKLVVEEGEFGLQTKEHQVTETNIRIAVNECVADEIDMVEIADGCADVDYINNGIATRCGIDLDPVKAEVHRSNMSKFIDGHRREDGKWVKGPSYTPANIARVLLEQCEGVTQEELDAIDLIEKDGDGLEAAMKAAKELLGVKLNLTNLTLI